MSDSVAVLFVERGVCSMSKSPAMPRLLRGSGSPLLSVPRGSDDWLHRLLKYTVSLDNYKSLSFTYPEATTAVVVEES